MTATLDLQRTCRTCVSKTRELVPLLTIGQNINGGSGPFPGANKSIGEMLMECANVEFDANDGLPQYVCVECASALRAAFAYKRLCEESDAKLRQIVRQHLSNTHTKVERMKEGADQGEVCSFEERWLDVSISELFDERSSEFDDNLPAPSIEKKATIDRASDAFALKESTVNSAGGVAKKSECEKREFICDICNTSFVTRRKISRHFKGSRHQMRYRQHYDTDVAADSLESTPDWDEQELGEDNKIVSRAKRVKNHHAKDFPCENCDKVFGTKVALREHTYEAHEPPPKYACKLCSKEFIRLFNLNQHLLTHKTPRPEMKHKCEICSRVFNRANTLKRHHITHTKEKNFPCEICHRKLGSKHVLRGHMRIHGDRSKDEYHHLCPHCGRTFQTVSHMRGHIRTEHTGETPYKCEDCELAFHRSDLLAHHRLKHVPRFICTICSKSLSSKERLIAHSRIHSGEKTYPYKCSLCDKAYSQPKSLKTHLLNHSGDVPNKCRVCGEVFINPRRLEIHCRLAEH